MVYYCWCWEKK